MPFEPTPLAIALAIILSTSPQVIAAPHRHHHNNIIDRSVTISDIQNEQIHQRHPLGPMHTATPPSQTSTVTTAKVRTVTVFPTPVTTSTPRETLATPLDKPILGGTRRPVSLLPSSNPSTTTSSKTSTSKKQTSTSSSLSSSQAVKATSTSSASSSSSSSLIAAVAAATSSSSSSSTTTSSVAAAAASSSVVVIPLPSSSLTITISMPSSVSMPSITMPSVTMPSKAAVESSAAAEALSVLASSVATFTTTTSSQSDSTNAGSDSAGTDAINSATDTTSASTTSQQASTTTTAAKTLATGSACSAGKTRKCCSAIQNNLKSVVGVLDGLMPGLDLNFLAVDTTYGVNCKDIDDDDTAADGSVCWDVVSCCETNETGIGSVYLGCVPVV